MAVHKNNSRDGVGAVVLIGRQVHHDANIIGGDLLQLRGVREGVLEANRSALSYYVQELDTTELVMRLKFCV